MNFIKETNKFEKTLSKLKQEFSKEKEILVVYVYGSVARGDYSERHSDLDLFIVLNKKKVPASLKEKINNLIIPIGIANSVKIHLEYQGLEIRTDDQTLIAKMIEEGKIIFSRGVFNFSYQQLGLKQYIIYSYSLKDSKNKTMFSKALHGRKSWYYSGKKKIVKEYSGVADNDEIILLGKGAIMVLKKRQKDVENLFKLYDVSYNITRIVYG
ncbi:nucleotidyltransferase domain-containing protein [Candidatus Woesearchaeota archaeon]|nr:nucleotidyltransferase domain-containing protein [Candidatus Woesearchaeota archaeon]